MGEPGGARRGAAGAAARGLTVLAALICALLVAGCSGIPSGGPVLQGRSGERDPSEFRAIAAPPPVGATPEEIVRGFLLAGGAPASPTPAGSEFATAREFLSDAQARAWRPDAGTVVFSGQAPELSVSADGRAVPNGSQVGSDVRSVTVTARMSVVATIDAAGRYSVAPPDEVRTIQFSLVRREGQWRIDGLPDGLLVAESLLGLVYRSYELYFLDPSRRVLVPETRWFLNRGSNATTLARELLAGPSPWLNGAVATSIPVGTQLATPGTVRVEEGVAVVDLSAPAARTSSTQRALMLAQLRATLLPVPDVDAVRITVDGAEIDVPAPAPGLAVDPGVDPAPVLLLQDGLVRLEAGDAVVPVEGLPDLAGRDVSHPGLSYENPDRYAVLAEQRSQLLLLTPGTDQQPLEPVLTGADLTAPSFDRFGWVWSTQAASGGTVTAVSAAGDPREVAAPWLAGRRIQSLRISRDGTRAVVASTDPDGQGHVEVAGVARDDEYAPLALSPDGPLSVGVRMGQVEQAVWLDDVTVAVLGRSGPEDDEQVHVIRIGGRYAPPLTPVPGSTGLAAGDGEGTMLIATSSGQVVERAGSAWLPLPELQGARYPAFAG